MPIPTTLYLLIGNLEPPFTLYTNSLGGDNSVANPMEWNLRLYGRRGVWITGFGWRTRTLYKGTTYVANDLEDGYYVMMGRAPLFVTLNVNHTRIEFPPKENSYLNGRMYYLSTTAGLWKTVRWKILLLGGEVSLEYAPVVPIVYYDFFTERTIYAGKIKNALLWNLSLSVGLAFDLQ